MSRTRLSDPGEAIKNAMDACNRTRLTSMVRSMLRRRLT
jgi:hypothetical protein